MKFILIFLCCVIIIQGDKQESNDTATSQNVKTSFNEVLASDLLKMSELVTNDTGHQDQPYSKTPITTEKPDLFDDVFYPQFRAAVITNLKNKTEEDHPYPYTFNVTITLEEFVHSYIDLNEGELLENVTLSIAGRIVAIGTYGSEIYYYDLKTDSGVIQVLVPSKNFKTSRIRLADIIGCVGHPGKSRRGELTFVPKYIKLLAPSLHEIPEHLNEDDYRSKKRYINLIRRDESKKVFRTRAETITYIRQFLDNLEFLEVETPILNKIPSGATAKPFKTHYDDLHKDYFLRISPKSYHKMLVIGGFDRVYEIGKQFKNAKLDSTHSPEFTTCQFTMAYADYNDLMNLTETLLPGLVKSLHGSYKIKYHPEGPNGEEAEIDFTPPFARVPVIPTLEKALNITFLPADQLHTTLGRFFLEKVCKLYIVDCPPPTTSAKLLDRLIAHFIQEKITQPTFLIDYPVTMYPLAKYHRDIPGLSESFELFVMKSKVLNGYTEQNDPVELSEQLQQQAAIKKVAGDDEIPPTDEELIKALEFGLPPCAGGGIDIDPLTMFLTDSNKIKEVVLFPSIEEQVRGIFPDL